MALENLLVRYSRNGVLPLSKLRAVNYPLFKFIVRNIDIVKSKNTGVELLDDLKSIKDMEKIKLYLRYHFNDTVNLTVLRNEHRYVYNCISSLGNPHDVIKEMGFKVIYEKSDTEDTLREKLREISNEDGVICSLGPLYDKVYYRARKENMTVAEYLNKLGFTYRTINVNDLIRLRQEGKSYQEIADIIGVSKTTVFRYLQVN